MPVPSVPLLPLPANEFVDAEAVELHVGSEGEMTHCEQDGEQEQIEESLGDLERDIASRRRAPRAARNRASFVTAESGRSLGPRADPPMTSPEERNSRNFARLARHLRRRVWRDEFTPAVVSTSTLERF